jgi:hypothetical protein
MIGPGGVVACGFWGEVANKDRTRIVDLAENLFLLGYSKD